MVRAPSTATVVSAAVRAGRLATPCADTPRDHHRLPARRPARAGGRRRSTAGAGRGAHLDAPARAAARGPGRGRAAAGGRGLRGLDHPPAAARDGRYAEAVRLARAALAVAPGPLWLSHLPAEQVRRLAASWAGRRVPVPVRARVGTRLWLGDAAGRRTTATVLDVHRVRRGERAGYRHGSCPVTAGSWWSPAAPRTASASRHRRRRPRGGSGRPRWRPGRWRRPGWRSARSRSTGGSAGSWNRRTCSRAWSSCPGPPPDVGDEVPVELRLTTATVDAVQFA